MKPFAIEPDDRAFAVARAGVVLASSPSAVSEGSAAQAVGADAWHLVRQHPTTTSTRHLGSVLHEAQPSARALSLVAAELARRLTAHPPAGAAIQMRSEEHTSELQSRVDLVCRLLLEKKKKNTIIRP